MNKKYVVVIDDLGNKYWYKYGSKRTILHREDGPAVEWVDTKVKGMRVLESKYWYLNDEKLSEEEFNKRMNKSKKSACNGKVVEIDGNRYKLIKL